MAESRKDQIIRKLTEATIALADAKSEVLKWRREVNRYQAELAELGKEG